MKKFFSLFAAVLFAGSMMATVVTITPDNCGWTNSAGAQSSVVDGVTIANTNGLVGVDGSTGVAALRIYKNATLTISAEQTITSIVFTCAENGTTKYGPGCFGEQDGYSFDAEGPTGTWTGSATSVSFVASANQVRATQIVVTIDDNAAPVAAYYLVGNFNNWQADEAYKLTTNPGNSAEKMIKGVELVAGDSLKIIGILGETTNWYPADAANYGIQEDGEYNIYFRADTLGNDDWYCHFFYVEKVFIPATCAEARTAVLALENNKYLLDAREISLVGYVTEYIYEWSEDFPNVTFWMADEADGGQVLEVYHAVCASAADAPVVGDRVKVTGKLKKYYKAASGDKEEVITPEFDGGCTFEILSGTAIDNTNVEAKAVKFFENGQLIIIKNGVRYNAQGAIVR